MILIVVLPKFLVGNGKLHRFIGLSDDLRVLYSSRLVLIGETEEQTLTYFAFGQCPLTYP
jgi:hypothetical protein